IDGARNAGKLARSVRSRGKAGDCIKRLPIADENGAMMDYFKYSIFCIYNRGHYLCCHGNVLW
ncbi:hypothetical protein, partial [Bacillus benzoevorans]|uniref:hypothetical protein n=1 Tax=Bacillus benzoevorans TaxID=1456 RepID=UPI001C86B3CB